jgi:hypothetical protein
MNPTNPAPTRPAPTRPAPTRPAPTRPAPSDPAPSSGYPDEELHWALGQVEDWLLHASDETLDELAEFVYGPIHHDHKHLRWIIELLGEAGARFRPAPSPPGQSTLTPACADRGPGR